MRRTTAPVRCIASSNRPGLLHASSLQIEISSVLKLGSITNYSAEKRACRRTLWGYLCALNKKLSIQCPRCCFFGAIYFFEQLVSTAICIHILFRDLDDVTPRPRRGRPEREARARRTQAQRDIDVFAERRQL